MTFASRLSGARLVVVDINDLAVRRCFFAAGGPDHKVKIKKYLTRCSIFDQLKPAV